MSISPENGVPLTNEEYRLKSILEARRTGNTTIADFLNNRLTFQRGSRGSERDAYNPWENPDDALLDTLLTVRGEEGEHWTNAEDRKSKRVIAAFVSLTFPNLPEDCRRFWTDPSMGMMDDFFSNKRSVKLKDDEVEALATICHRVGREIDIKVRFYPRPEVSEE